MADASEKQREKSDSEESSTSSSGDAGSSESEHDAATVLVQMASTPPRQGKNDAKSKEEENASDEPPAKKSKPEPDPLATRTGGAYIPPAKLRMMQQQIEDKSSAAYQRIAWEALKKSINGLINKVNTSNVAVIVQELIQENIIRGRGLLVRSLLQAQAASTTFTNVYAGLVSVVNTKFPQNGELLLRRLIYQFRRSFRRNNKPLCLSSATFIAHLVNQQVAHEVLALELLTLLLETPTDDSVEIAVAFLKECGLKLTEVTSRGVHFVFERIRGILTEATIDKRVQYMIDVLFAVRKDKYKDYPAVISELDLVEESEQVTHLLTLEDDGDPEDHLNVFKFDPEYLENEEKYKTIKADILGEGASDESGSGEESEEEDDDDEEQTTEITDATQTNIMGLRRTVYLTIMSSVDYEECAHKMVKMQLKPGQEGEVCFMIIECCSQERSFLKFYGLLAERFCRIDKSYEEQFTACFQEQYETIHRLETNKLRNIAKLFAHLFYTDAIPWTCLVCVHLNEDETTSSSRIFIKILFQEIAEFLGLPKLNERLKDPTLSAYFEGLLPRDNPRNTRFSINFFTSIGLGGLTDELREHLKSAPKMIMSQQRNVESSDSSSGSGSSGSDSSSSDDSDSDSDDSEEDRRRHQIERGRRHRPEASTRSRNDREEERRREHHRDDRRGRDDDRARREGTRDERRSNNKDRSERDSPRRDRRERERDDRRRDEKRGRERRRGDSDERTERRDTRYGRGRDD